MFLSTFNGKIIAVIPRTRPILAILLPIIFPIAISLDSFIEAVKLTANSGLEVPKAITVNPIINGLMPSSRDKFDEPLTSHSAPKYTPKNPIINKIH